MSDYENQIAKYEVIRCNDGACHNEQVIDDLQSLVSRQRIHVSVQGVALLTKSKIIADTIEKTVEAHSSLGHRCFEEILMVLLNEPDDREVTKFIAEYKREDDL